MTLGRQQNGSTASARAGNKNQFRALVQEIERLGGHLYFSGAQNKDKCLLETVVSTTDVL